MANSSNEVSAAGLFTVLTFPAASDIAYVGTATAVPA
jgi:hypothetical protein